MLNGGEGWLHDNDIIHSSPPLRAYSDPKFSHVTFDNAKRRQAARKSKASDQSQDQIEFQSMWDCVPYHDVI